MIKLEVNDDTYNYTSLCLDYNELTPEDKRKFGYVRFFTNVSEETNPLECYVEDFDHGAYFSLPNETYNLFSDQILPDYKNG